MTGVGPSTATGTGSADGDQAEAGQAAAPPTIAGILTRFYGDSMISAEQRKAARKETNIAMNDSMLKLRRTYQRERERTLREQYAQGAWAGLLKGYGSEGSAESETIKNAYARAAGLTEAESRGFITPTIAQQQSNVGNASGDRPRRSPGSGATSAPSSRA